MSFIKNVIFDFGGVFIDIDYQKTEDAFVALGIKNFATYYKQDFVNQLFNDLEIGKISPEVFYSEFRKLTNSTLTNAQIQTAWNALLKDYFIDRLNWLEIIKTKVNIYLFSNTNQIHYDFFIELYNKLNLPHSFDSNFIKAYYSHTFRLRKPNADSFLKIIDEQNLIASETLFIDDTLKNIEGAKVVGLQTLHLLQSMNLIDEVEKLL